MMRQVKTTGSKGQPVLDRNSWIRNRTRELIESDEYEDEYSAAMAAMEEYEVASGEDFNEFSLEVAQQIASHQDSDMVYDIVLSTHEALNLVAIAAKTRAERSVSNVNATKQRLTQAKQDLRRVHAIKDTLNKSKHMSQLLIAEAVSDMEMEVGASVVRMNHLQELAIKHEKKAQKKLAQVAAIEQAMKALGYDGSSQ